MFDNRTPPTADVFNPQFIFIQVRITGLVKIDEVYSAVGIYQNVTRMQIHMKYLILY